jgi:hypothetical protein
MSTARPSELDTATIRRLAVEADVDPRSVERRLRGERVRGLAGHRIDRVLAAHDLAPGVMLSRAA